MDARGWVRATVVVLSAILGMSWALSQASGGAPAPRGGPPPAAAPSGAPPAAVPPRPDEHTIYIPYKDLQKVFEREGRGVYMPYEEFMELWRQARGPTGSAEAPVAAFIASAAYKGGVKGDLATLDASYQVQVLRPGWSRLKVGLTGVAISKATLGGEPARLVTRDDGAYDLLLSEKGTFQLDVSFVATVRSEPGKKWFSFGSPAVPVSQIQVDVPEKDVNVEVQPLLAATRTPQGDGTTRVMAFLGSTGSVRVEWQPRAVEIAQLTPLVFVTNNSRTDLSEGVLRTSTTLAITVLRAPVSTFKISLPAGVRLISIKGANLKDWSVAGAAALPTGPPAATQPAAQVLTVELHAGITGDYSLALELEAPLAADAAQVVVPEVALLGAQRETGYVAVSTAPTLRSEVLAQTNLSQVDVSELPPPLRAGAGVLGYRFLKHPYELRLGIARITPHVEVVALDQITIEKERLRLDARLDYRIQKVGVFGVRVQVPAGLTVTDVAPVGGSAMSDFRVRPGAAGQPTVVDVTLRERTLGAFRLAIQAEAKRPAVEGPVVLPTVEALDIDREEGYVAVLAPEVLNVVQAQITGLTPVDVNQLTAQGASAGAGRVFGYRYLRRPIAATVDVTQRKTKVTVEVLSLYEAARDVVRARVVLAYDIQYAGTDTLKFQAPKSISDSIRVSGESLKEQKALPAAADSPWVTWQVVLQREVTGPYTLRVEYDLNVATPVTRAVAPPPVDLPVLRVTEADPTVERETGQIALVKSPELELAPTVKGLEVIDPRELAAPIRRTDVVAAFKYYVPTYSLAVSIQRHEFAEVATTVATKAALETIVGKNGAITARALWRLKTSQRQFLDVTLPAGAVLSGVAVDGQPVQPQKGAGADAYLVRLGTSAGGEREALVEAVYTLPAPASAARQVLAAPQLAADVPVQKFYWLAYLSDDRYVLRLSTDLTDETHWETRGGWVMRPTAMFDLNGWIGAGGVSAAAFEPPGQAQAFLLSGMNAGHSITLVTADRRTAGIVIFVGLLALGVLFARTRTAVKLALVIVLAAAVLLVAIWNDVAVLEGLSAGVYGILAVTGVWLLEYVFLRIPRSVRERRAALAIQTAGGTTELEHPAPPEPSTSTEQKEEQP